MDQHASKLPGLTDRDRDPLWRFVRRSFLVLLFVGITYCGFAVREKRQARHWARLCMENLTKIDGAKEQYALEHNKRPGDPITWDNLYKPDGTGCLKQLPKEPHGETYTINAIGTNPTCSSKASGHALPLVGTVVSICE